MARKATKAPKRIDEGKLTKGQLRKLNALKKSIGDELGEKAFAEWLALQPTEKPVPEDKVAAVVGQAVEKALAQKDLRMPRGGYIVKRGRGRMIVTPAK